MLSHMTGPESDSSELSVLSAETDARNNLRELTSQSWNLELVISGAALFATLSLASSLDDALAYYRYNLMPDQSIFHDILPVQIVSLCKATCYILFGAFLINFIMRAFWVALVGLLAAYPSGIRYDQIALLSHYARERMARRLGLLDDYVIRLDRRCNVVFALASVIAIVFIFVALSYILLVLLTTTLQIALPPTTYATVLHLFRYVAWALLILYGLLIIVGALPAMRDHPRVAPISFHTANGAYWLMPGVGRAVQYIMYTFMSNLSGKMLYQRIAAIFVVFILIEIVTMFVDISRVKGLQLDSRSFMSLNAPSSVIEQDAYDNLRPETALTERAAIQADVIREPYVKLFIAYPKLLDEDLNKRFKEPAWPDSLKGQSRRERRAAWRLNALNKYFGVSLNDSLYQSPGFLFIQRADNGQRGLTTVLLTNNLKTGRNMLTVTIPDPSNKPQTYCQIPFWYVPEN